MVLSCVARGVRASIAAVMLFSIAPAVAWGSPKTPTSPSASAADLMNRAIQNGLKYGWAHVDIRASGKSSKSVVFSDDAGPDAGTQLITLGEMRARVVLVDETVYISGNKAAMSRFFGFGDTAGTPLAGGWVSQVPSDAGYETASGCVTLASVLDHYTLVEPLELGRRTTLNGQRVIPISGRTKPEACGGQGRATLYVTTENEVLPLRIVVANKEGHQTVDLSSWGVNPNVAAPSPAIPIALLTTTGNAPPR